MDYRKWCAEMRQAIECYMRHLQAVYGDLLRLDPDTVTDEVDPAALARARKLDPPFPQSLVEFYAVISAVDLGQLYNGYFVHPLDRVLDSLRCDDIPAWVPGLTTERMVVFATDGGGRMFAAGFDTGTVFRLPVGGTANRVYEGSTDSIGPDAIAKDVPDFLTRMLLIAQTWTGGEADKSLLM